jgi:hypothetical protein
VEVSGQKPLEDMPITIINIPLWQRGMEGDFKKKSFLKING